MRTSEEARDQSVNSDRRGRHLILGSGVAVGWITSSDEGPVHPRFRFTAGLHDGRVIGRAACIVSRAGMELRV